MQHGYLMFCHCEKFWDLSYSFPSSWWEVCWQRTSQAISQCHFHSSEQIFQQMQIHPHLSYYINLLKRINKKKYKTIIRIYEIYNPFNCNNNLLETTSIQDCRGNRAGLGAYMCMIASMCFPGEFPVHWKEFTGSFL